MNRDLPTRYRSLTESQTKTSFGREDNRFPNELPRKIQNISSNPKLLVRKSSIKIANDRNDIAERMRKSQKKIREYLLALQAQNEQMEIMRSSFNAQRTNPVRTSRERNPKVYQEIINYSLRKPNQNLGVPAIIAEEPVNFAKCVNINRQPSNRNNKIENFQNIHYIENQTSKSFLDPPKIIEKMSDILSNIQNLRERIQNRRHKIDQWKSRNKNM